MSQRFDAEGVIFENNLHVDLDRFLYKTPETRGWGQNRCSFFSALRTMETVANIVSEVLNCEKFFETANFINSTDTK